jgi:hypothetical protein
MVIFIAVFGGIWLQALWAMSQWRFHTHKFFYHCFKLHWGTWGETEKACLRSNTILRGSGTVNLLVLDDLNKMFTESLLLILVILFFFSNHHWVLFVCHVRLSIIAFFKSYLRKIWWPSANCLAPFSGFEMWTTRICPQSLEAQASVVWLPPLLSVLLGVCSVLLGVVEEGCRDSVGNGQESWILSSFWEHGRFGTTTIDMCLMERPSLSRTLKHPEADWWWEKPLGASRSQGSFLFSCSLAGRLKTPHPHGFVSLCLFLHSVRSVFFLYLYFGLLQTFFLCKRFHFTCFT